jgi:heme-degrading monooxygenase HmoA
VNGRLWRGWTAPGDAEAYEGLLRDTVLPGLAAIEGYEGGFVLRRDAGDEVEFTVLNLFESLDAVRAFAGDDYEVPVFEPEARRLLTRVEPIARHYEVRVRATGPAGGIG